VDVGGAATPMADDEDRVFGDFGMRDFFVVSEAFAEEKRKHDRAEGDAVREAGCVPGADVEVVLGKHAEKIR